MRWFCRFPSHKIDDDISVSTDKQTICFIAQDDVLIYGFGFYNHFRNLSEINYLNIETKIWVHDAGDNYSPIYQKEIDRKRIDYNDTSYDENKIIKVDWIEKGFLDEPVPVYAGQKFRLTQIFHHNDYRERVHYGVDGDKYDQVQNMDMGIFKVEASKYYSCDTSV